jgi:hypothetical protein
MSLAVRALSLAREEGSMKRVLPLFLSVAVALAASLVAQAPDPALLTLDRVFSGDEFAVRSFGPARWLDQGSRYTTVERSAAVDGAQDIVAYDSDRPVSSGPVLMSDYAAC